MADRYLLDTNAAIARINGDTKIATLLVEAEAVFIAVIVIGELYFGAENSGRVAQNLQQVEKLVAALPILVCDQETARQYGRVEHQLRSKGRPIPQNDIWIAAIAQQYGLTILTRDEHFSEVGGLTVQSW